MKMKFYHHRSKLKFRYSNQKSHLKTRYNQLQTCLKMRSNHLQSHLKMRSSHHQYLLKIIKVYKSKKKLNKSLSKRNPLAHHLILRCISSKILESKESHSTMHQNKILSRNQQLKNSKIKSRNYKTSS